MIFCKQSEGSKLRKQADKLVQMAGKVYHYRRDVMSEAQLEELTESASLLQEMVRDKRFDPEDIRPRMERMERIMREVGGRIYPVTFLSENVEVLLVAAILAIGIRAFFIQPFKIPTNSMYPTYSGMVAEYYESPEEEPGALGKLTDRFLTWSSFYHVEAPVAGELCFPIRYVRDEASGIILGRENVIEFDIVPSKMFSVIPTKAKRYYFYVGAHRLHVDVPAEFDIEPMILRTFFPNARGFSDLIDAGRLRRMDDERFLLLTGKRLQRGEAALSFSIQTGDMLFVDRLSYNFVPPQVGDPFVFRTGDITKGKYMRDDKYYIKRLVGQGGDALWVDDYTLMRNGHPAEGVPAFAKNAEREGEYGGYFALEWDKHGDPHLDPSGLLGPLEKVPEAHYYAMGDNSQHSSDSRFWGYVPEHSVVGRALFIFYPFTHRWGLAE